MRRRGVIIPASSNTAVLLDPYIPMVRNRPRRHSSRFVIALLLTLAMVCAHWQGLVHRIAHATQYSTAAADYAANGLASSHQKAVQHSCLAYDAATVAEALHTPPCTTAVLQADRILARWAAFDSWNAPFAPYFSSRAPPSA